MAAASSSTQFFGIREDDSNQMKQQQQQQQQQTSTAPTSSTAPSSAPQKKKRNLPGTPYPDAEVIALSPKTLMATNRFICEVCNKGFQREQNLQLHRRGHNLPWKLRQKSTKEVKRKVYLCPEPTCVHHDPSRALGDLTGIKKHFCRKHGEKKWKCEKCSKRYAVQSDWKAHSKTCGTREYRCDCGTLFSRRDSFITHRAFCDALAQESARLPTAGLNTMPGAGHHLYTAGRNTGLALSGQLSALQDHHQPTDILRLGAVAAQFDHLLPPTSAAFRPPHHPTPSPFFLPNFHHEVDQNTTSLIQTKPFSGGLLPLPDNAGSSSSSSAAAAAGLFNLAFFSNNNSNNNIIGDQLSNGNGNGGGAEAPATLFSGGSMIDADGGGHGHIPPLYNEPALPQMSATALLQKAAQMGATTSSNGGAFLRAFGSSSSSSNKFDRPPASSFLPATMRSQMETDNHLQDLMNSLANGGSDGLTRDFLGVGGIMRSIGREHGGGHGRHHGIDISSLDGDMKSKAGGMRPSFGGGT